MSDEHSKKDETQDDLPLFWDTDSSEKKEPKVSVQKDLLDLNKETLSKENIVEKEIIEEVTLNPNIHEVKTQSLNKEVKPLEILGPTPVEHQENQKKGIKDSQIFILPEVKGSLSEQLLDARGSIGMSIQEVSEKTKISKDFILALELAHFSELPEAVYVKTYIKQLCKLYDTSYTDMLKEYDKILLLQNKTKSLNKNNDDILNSMNKGTTDLRKLVYAIILIVCVILISVAGYRFANKKGYFVSTKGIIKSSQQTQTTHDLIKYLPKLKLKKRILRVPAYSK